VLNDSTLLASGVLRGDWESPRIHLLSLSRGSVLRSFFAPYSTVRNRTAAVTAAWTSFDVRHDSLVAVFPASDSVYVYALDGHRDRVFPLPSREFRPVPEERAGDLANPRERAEWLESFDLVADVHWITPDTIIVAYQNVVVEKALERQWHLLGVSARTGARLFEIRDAPRLYAADPGSRRLVLGDPTREMPNEWLVGFLR
jgi:hypothetical protein